MEESRSTLVEQRHPRLRRKNTTMIDSFLKQTFANSFLTFVQTQNQQSQRPSLKESEEMIQFHYKKLHKIIDTVDQHLGRRLQNHEKQLFTIAKEQILKMRSEMEQVVEKLNAAIKQKNIDDEIWQLSNELDYFKSQTYQLFQQNKMLRQDMKKLKKEMKENQIELENSSKVMQKLKYASMKAKLQRDSVSQTKNKKIRQASLPGQKSNRSISNNPHFKTQNSEPSNNKNVKEMDIGVQLPKQSIVNIKTSIKSGQGRSKTMNVDEGDPLTHDFSFQSHSILRSGSDNGVGRVNFVKVISQISEQLVSNDQKLHKHDKSVQTDPPIFHYQPNNAQPQLRQLFSKASCVNHMVKQIKQRHIDLCKNGFYVKAFNGSKATKSKTGHGSPSSSKDLEQMRYMNITFNNNKIRNENNGKLRTRGNVFS